VTVSNSRIFDEPVYNYTREFPFIWEELTIPISYGADRSRVEEILLDVARRNSGELLSAAERDLARLERRYALSAVPVEPKVYLVMTDNWLELTVRFVTEARGVRDVKDTMSRQILSALDEAGIGLASATGKSVCPRDNLAFVAPRPAHTGRVQSETAACPASTDHGVSLTSGPHVCDVVLRHRGVEHVRSLLVADTAAAERLDGRLRLPPFEDVDAARIDQIRGDGEVEAAQR